LQQLRFWLNDIARSAGMERMVRSVKRGLDAIETELQRRRREASAALSTFAQACTIAPLTPQVWTKAYLRWQANMPPFRELDCLVMESLLAFLQRQKAKLTMFLTLDVEDFDHPEVREEFQRRKTLLLFEPRDVIVEFRKFYGVM
jgi:phytoene dehydrogenase-like protein